MIKDTRTFALRVLPISLGPERLELKRKREILFSWGGMGWSLGLLEQLESERNPRKERATEEDIYTPLKHLVDPVTQTCLGKTLRSPGGKEQLEAE